MLRGRMTGKILLLSSFDKEDEVPQKRNEASKTPPRDPSLCSGWQRGKDDTRRK